MASVKRAIFNARDAYRQYQTLQRSISEGTTADTCHIVGHALECHRFRDADNTLVGGVALNNHHLIVTCLHVIDPIHLIVVGIETDNVLEEFPTFSVPIGLNGIHGYK